MGSRLIFARLAQRFPPPEPSVRDGVLILLVGSVLTSVLLTFLHYNGATQITNHAQLFIVTSGLIAMTSALITRNFVPYALPIIFIERTWTIGREIIFELVYLQVIALTLMLVAFAFHYINLTVYSYLSFVGATALFGILPVALKVQLTANHFLKNNIRQMQRLLPDVQTPECPDQKITLYASTKDQFTLMQSRLLFINAQQNYCEISFLHKNEICQHLMRQNIGALEKQLIDTQLIRCHRSYLVNTNMVEKIKGNAQGYQLHIKNSALIVPLSRGYATSALPLLNDIQSIIAA